MDLLYHCCTIPVKKDAKYLEQQLHSNGKLVKQPVNNLNLLAKNLNSKADLKPESRVNTDLSVITCFLSNRGVFLVSTSAA